MTMTVQRNTTSKVDREGYEAIATRDLEMGHPDTAMMHDKSLVMPRQSRTAAPRVAPPAPCSVSTNGLKHIAKSSVYGLVIGATALTGGIFLLAVRDDKMTEAMEAAPGKVLMGLEFFGCSVGAAGGAIIGILQLMRC